MTITSIHPKFYAKWIWSFVTLALHVEEKLRFITKDFFFCLRGKDCHEMLDLSSPRSIQSCLKSQNSLHDNHHCRSHLVSIDSFIFLQIYIDYWCKMRSFKELNKSYLFKLVNMHINNVWLIVNFYQLIYTCAFHFLSQSGDSISTMICSVSPNKVYWNIMGVFLAL